MPFACNSNLSIIKKNLNNFDCEIYTQQNINTSPIFFWAFIKDKNSVNQLFQTFHYYNIRNCFSYVRHSKILLVCCLRKMIFFLIKKKRGKIIVKLFLIENCVSAFFVFVLFCFCWGGGGGGGPWIGRLTVNNILF